MQDETKISEIELAALGDEVIKLHGLARTLELSFGKHIDLSRDLRHCADQLQELLNRH